MFYQKLENPVKNQLRIAFDLDAVLFSDESERVYKEQGFRAFVANEQVKVDEPLQEVILMHLHVLCVRQSLLIIYSKLLVNYINFAAYVKLTTQ